MGLSEEATQMVRGGFEPGTFRSPVRYLAIVATPYRAESRKRNIVQDLVFHLGLLMIYWENYFDKLTWTIITGWTSGT